MIRVINIFMIALLLSPYPANAERSERPDGTVEIFLDDVCATQADSKSSGLSDLKAFLLTQAKRGALTELFGEYVHTETNADESGVRSSTFASASGILRTEGNPVYYNGDGLGEICIDVVFSADKSVLKSLDPEHKKVVKFCHGGAAGAFSLPEIKKAAWAAAIKAELSKIDPVLMEADAADIRQLASNLAIENESVDVSTGAYCADYEFDVSQFEVLEFGRQYAARGRNLVSSRSEPAAPKGTGSQFVRRVDVLVEVAPVKDNGKPWDFAGGAPDIAVCVIASTGEKKCFPPAISERQHPQCRDSYGCRLQGIQLPEGTFNVLVLDVDVARNDLIGSGVCQFGHGCRVGQARIRFE